ncbi:hypothetical protein ACCAA_100014 [Candidatus Accumulibacter aalborgensis]|uniref:Uncharacterized protein n=1 Tax=Candidatus Accumulibacter aalborgensis TaxID=1860102 RepID=A0A1A8XDJ9_9PROT|nr:hypothetical protein ACCAA_100014 [Candidatus Accumulibacter aalborgensis]
MACSADHSHPGAAPATVDESKDLQYATVPTHGKAQVQGSNPLVSPETGLRHANRHCGGRCLGVLGSCPLLRFPSCTCALLALLNARRCAHRRTRAFAAH